MSRSTSIFFILFLVSCLIGCSRSAKPVDLPGLYPCSITLTQEGQPLRNATVMLYSADPEFKWAVIGFSDEQGKAVLKTHAQFPGAPLGEYQVVVLKTEEVPKGNTVDVFTLIDKKYAENDSTPLSITIGKKKNAEQFELGAATRTKLRTVVL